MSFESKIIDLETKIAFQDNAIEELSESLFQLDKKINTLTLLCESLQQKLHTLSRYSEIDAGSHNEKPPHY